MIALGWVLNVQADAKHAQGSNFVFITRDIRVLLSRKSAPARTRHQCNYKAKLTGVDKQ